MSVLESLEGRAVVEQILTLKSCDLAADSRDLPPCDRPARNYSVKMLRKYLVENGGAEASGCFEAEIGKHIEELTRAEIEAVLYLYFEGSAA